MQTCGEPGGTRRVELKNRLPNLKNFALSGEQMVDGMTITLEEGTRGTVVASADSQCPVVDFDLGDGVVATVETHRGHLNFL
jgi:hypothetical protein